MDATLRATMERTVKNLEAEISKLENWMEMISKGASPDDEVTAFEVQVLARQIADATKLRDWVRSQLP